ncbi:hypothetical protein [Thalassolituus oleivorans]|uniref:hypothetical protein n=1 Tax=Thalassolituus oleivorans TaxID=187493 RepID=UPI001CE299F0|nr:hypothetical protein [Thalassolituus oleivorans]MCA6127778.1 hypothetical protein [Thalassolituus oleivorans 4BN06-13]
MTINIDQGREDLSDYTKSSNPDMADTDTSKEEALAKSLADQLMALSSQTGVAVKELGDLFRLELQLSFGDARRLLLTWLALIPVIILTWISATVLAAWLVYDFSASVTLALTTFMLLQMLLCTFLLIVRKRFRKGLGFKRTKTHAKRLLQGMTDTGDQR